MATERVQITLQPEVLAELDRLAKDANMDRSSFIEFMVNAMKCLGKNDFKAMTNLVYSTLINSMKEKIKKT